MASKRYAQAEAAGEEDSEAVETPPTLHGVAVARWALVPEVRVQLPVQGPEANWSIVKPESSGYAPAT